jgi:glutamate carboxypeptidase
VKIDALRIPLAEALPTALALLERLVNIDSPSDHPDGVAAVLSLLAEPAGQLGGELEWRDEGGQRHLRATFHGGARRVGLLGHADTVFPLGTAEFRPFRTADHLAYGPGVADMKGGLVLALVAIERLLALEGPRPTVELVVVGDEESRLVPPPFMDVLGQTDACLVLEAGGRDGHFVLGRKTGAWVRLVSQGRAAHSGTEPERGSSAILALCREVLRVAELDGTHPGLTVSAGKLQGGSMTNVVPERAEAALDIRSLEPAHLDEALQQAAAFDSHRGVRLSMEIDGRWPPMDPGPSSRALASTYEALARDAGVPTSAELRGGMSDGCWVAAAGVPTLDGLGPVGGFDHGPDEFIDLASFGDRAALLVGLLVAIEEHGIQSPGRNGDHA